MRSPHALGLPARFSSWRPNQLDAVLTIASSGDGVDVLNAPTGSGKSAIYMSVAQLLDDGPTGRTVILTSTKSLQDQLSREFLGSVVDIRGQSNYPCELEKGAVQADQAVCHLGVVCHLKGRGCSYYDAYREALKARTVVTNYAYWLSCHEYGEGLGGFDMMVCDEAHNVMDELGNHMSVYVSDQDIDAFLERKPPPSDPEQWQLWADYQLLHLEPKLQSDLADFVRHPSNRSLMRRVYELKRIVKKLNSIRSITGSENWVFEQHDKGSFQWTPVWPGKGMYLLTRGIRKVILVSATISRKATDMLGLRGYRYMAYPSSFPARNRPVIHLRTGVKLRFDTDKAGLKAWVDAMDSIIKFRLDRKGIIHTVSYQRAEYLLAQSRYRGYMITHKRRDTAARVAEFKRAKAPAILVSPSMDTGISFEDSLARYQIIAKIPFPDSRSPVVEARSKVDRDYPFFLAMRTLVQMAGRIVRSADDWGETFIVDDNFEWMFSKYRRFAPDWFNSTVQIGASYVSQPRPMP